MQAHRQLRLRLVRVLDTLIDIAAVIVHVPSRTVNDSKRFSDVCQLALRRDPRVDGDACLGLILQVDVLRIALEHGGFARKFTAHDKWLFFLSQALLAAELVALTLFVQLLGHA